MLVAIDLDGTLIDESLVISAEDKTAIEAAIRRGFLICLASGRLYAASRPFAHALQLSGPIIVLQGAVAYDLGSDRRLFSTSLAPAVALTAYDYLKARDFHLQLYFGDSLYLDELNDRARFYLSISRVEPIMVGNLRSLLTVSPPKEPGPIKLLAVAPADTVLETIPVLAKVLGPSANVFRSMPVFLEVTDPHANKGEALRRVAEYVGIDMGLTAAIGDSDNDVSMLKAAAWSFAVANATPAAKAAAKQVVPARGHGVAYALHYLEGERAHEPA